MSVSGIVRRMDELGRIVIPKELRRTMRIKEGDEMEIFSEGESLIVRKHSRFDAFLRAAEKTTEILASATGCDVFLVAADKVAAAGGVRRKDALCAEVTEECAALASSREPAEINPKDGFCPVAGVRINAGKVLSFPLMSAGDVTGTLVVAGNDAEKWRDYFTFAAGLLASVCGE